MQPNRPQPCWQCSYLHVQCLVLPPLPPSPEGPGTKVAVVICRGLRLAHWHALIGEHTAWLLVPAPTWLGICHGLTIVPPLWDTLREAAKQIPSWVFMASKHCFKFTCVPPTNPYRHRHACKIQETAQETIAEAQPPLTPPHAKGLSVGPHAPDRAEQPRGLTYLRLLDDPPICRISNAVREHNTLHNLHKRMQYIKCYTKSTFAGSPDSCQTPCVGAEPVLAAQETHCTGCAAKPLYWQGYHVPCLSLNLQLCFCLTSDPNSDMGICFMFYMINTYFTEHLHRKPGSAAPYQHANFLVCVGRSPGKSLLAGWLGISR